MFPTNPIAHSLWRTIVAAIVFIGPVIITQYPSVGDLTISTVVFYALHYLEKRYLG